MCCVCLLPITVGQELFPGEIDLALAKASSSLTSRATGTQNLRTDSETYVDDGLAQVMVKAFVTAIKKIGLISSGSGSSFDDTRSVRSARGGAAEATSAKGNSNAGDKKDILGLTADELMETLEARILR